jgi:carbon starvation protein CstA
VIRGTPLATSAIGPWFDLSREQLILAMASCPFIASVVPVWMRLRPRDCAP